MARSSKPRIFTKIRGPTDAQFHQTGGRLGRVISFATRITYGSLSMRHVSTFTCALGVVLGLGFGSSAFAQTVKPADDWMSGFVMTQVKEVKIPSSRSAKITDFGALPDGKTLCTEAIAKAIDSLSSQGGGRLIIPAGIWLTGPIVLKSNI